MFCEYIAKIFELFDLFEICVIDVHVEGAWCPVDLHCLCLVDTDLDIVLLVCGVLAGGVLLEAFFGFVC